MIETHKDEFVSSGTSPTWKKSKLVPPAPLRRAVQLLLTLKNSSLYCRLRYGLASLSTQQRF